MAITATTTDIDVTELLDTIEMGILVEDAPQVTDSILPPFDSLTHVLNARTALDRLRDLLNEAEQARRYAEVA